MGGAQVGKIAKLIRGKYQFGYSIDFAKDELTKEAPQSPPPKRSYRDPSQFGEMIENEMHELINEGFFSKIKDFVTNVWTRLKSTFNKALSSLWGKFFNKKHKVAPLLNKLTSGYSIKEFTEKEGELFV